MSTRAGMPPGIRGSRPSPGWRDDSSGFGNLESSGFFPAAAHGRQAGQSRREQRASSMQFLVQAQANAAAHFSDARVPTEPAF